MALPVIELTIMAAEGLKNVSLLGGKMDPYAVAFVEPHRKFSTRVLRRGGKDPVWNDRMEIPVEPFFLMYPHAFLTFQVFHHSSINTSLIGATYLPLQNLLGNSAFKASDEGEILSLQLFRPSGRPHGILRVSLKVPGNGILFSNRLFGEKASCDAPATGFPVMEIQSGNHGYTYSNPYQFLPPGTMPYPKPPFAYTEPSYLPYPTPPAMTVGRNRRFLLGVISGVAAAILLGALF